MAETGKRDDPYQSFNFLVEIDNVTRAGFTECTGLTSETDPIDYREGADINLNVRKLPGLTKFPALVLKRGYTQDKSLWELRKKGINGQTQRFVGDLILLDEERKEVLRWRFQAGWIRQWQGPNLNAKTNEVAIETIEIVHEGLELVT